MLPSLFENLKITKDKIEKKVDCSTLNDESLAKTVEKKLILVSKLNEDTKNIINNNNNNNNNEEAFKNDSKTDDNVSNAFKLII